MTKWLKIFGRLEGTSFLLLLFVAMPLKYYADLPQGVKILGPLHGGLFLIYCGCAFMAAGEREWPFRQQLLAYAAAVVPFGTFLFERKFLSKEPGIARS
jgi:integral membrane protein